MNFLARIPPICDDWRASTRRLHGPPAVYAMGLQDDGRIMAQLLDQVLAPLPEPLRKPVRFGLFGGIGCLLAALLLGEVLFWLIRPPEMAAAPAAKPVDVMFVTDVSGSMERAISGIKRGINQFAGELKSAGLDARFGMVKFSDVRYNEPLSALSFGGMRFTNDPTQFRIQSDAVRLLDGMDPDESSMEGLQFAAESDFRAGADRVLILVTDAAPHSPGALNDTISKLRAAGVTQVHVICDYPFYTGLLEAFKCEQFSFAQLQGGDDAVKAVVSRISREIAARSVISLQSDKKFEASQAWRVVLAQLVWTAVIAVGIGVALLMGQNQYLRRPLISPKELSGGVLGSAAAGAAAGLIGPGIFTLLASSDALLLTVMGQMICWMLLGALIGVGLSFFIANLRAIWAAIGGAVGGFIGGTLFIMAAKIGGEIAGRLVGSFLIGFGIGAAIALVEAVVRSGWLEVKWSDTDKLRVNLGPEPVLVGSNREICRVPVRTAPPVALKAWIANGQVMGETTPGQPARPLADGEVIPAGPTANIIVHLGAASPVPTAGAAAGVALGGGEQRKWGAGQPVAPPPPPPQPVVAAANVACTIRMPDGSMKTIDPRNPLVVSASVRGLPKSAEGPLAALVPHPQQAGVVGLHNISKATWVARKPNGQTQQILPGATVRVEKGLSLVVGEAGFTVV